MAPHAGTGALTLHTQLCSAEASCAVTITSNSEGEAGEMQRAQPLSAAALVVL